MATTSCPSCHVRLPTGPGARKPTEGASAECLSRYDELAGYTLGLADPFFLHQVTVDAYAAQHATPTSKPITTAFVLIGLHLFVERGFTGRQVQLAHMSLARRSRTWPAFTGPLDRGRITVSDVLATPSGEARDLAIKEWARWVWAAWSPEHERVAELCSSHLKWRRG